MPDLITARLRLRRPRADDVSAILRIHGDPRTYRHAPHRVMRTLNEARTVFATMDRHWRGHGFGYAVVELLESGETIGFAGVRHQEIVGVPALNLYYRFDPSSHGQGYATEAVTAVLEQALRRHPDLPVVARVALVNAASARLAQRVGMAPTDIVDPHDPDPDIPHRLFVTRPLPHKAASTA